MPIAINIWKLGERVEAVEFGAIESESRLERTIEQDISILSPDLFLVGRQVRTPYGGIIDLLAVDANGKLVVIELKKHKTPREVVAQVLDYGAYVKDLSAEAIEGIYRDYAKKRGETDTPPLEEALCEAFNLEEGPEINNDHELLIVAAELDDSTERIIRYLTELSVSVNAVFFRYFKDGEREYLTRAWLMEPEEVDAKVAVREGQTWNGEYYVSFGGNERRVWEEARDYGFISAGGGLWYSRSLSMLEEGARVWVNIPKTGYVGVGEVVEEVVPIEEFMVEGEEGAEVPITEKGLRISESRRAGENPDKAEYLVRVNWIHTVSESEAVKEKGLFGNQNSAAKPVAKKWSHTIDRLKHKWGLRLE